MEVLPSPPTCELLEVEPRSGDPGSFVVSCSENCFPLPSEVGDVVRGAVTTPADGSIYTALVEEDGSFEVVVWTASGDTLAVYTEFPNGKRSLPCYLTVP